MTDRVQTVVLARRRDQLGGRLGAIVNAMSLAELLRAEFRFSWPREEELSEADQREIFSEEFNSRYELAPGELDGRTVLTEHEALNGASNAGPAAIDVNEIFSVIRGGTEELAGARQRYRRCFHAIGWSEAIQSVAARSGRWAERQRVAAIHVRAGDIVDGEWASVVHHEKYMPTTYIEHAIEHFALRGQAILVLSDNPRYLAWLAERFPSVLTTEDALPELCELTRLQRALAEIILLSHCETIIGPPSSAFSRVAANLGSGAVRRADALVPENRARELLLRGLERPGARVGFQAALAARDACWCLDVFGDELPLPARRTLVAEAVRLAPGFVGAQARFSRVSALTGDWERARAAAACAVRLAGCAQRSDDPLMEALSTAAAVECFATVAGNSPPATEHLERTLRRCYSLAPNWFDREAICTELRFLIDIAGDLATSPTPVRRSAARALERNPPDRLPLALLRERGLAAHRRVRIYDPVTRELQVMSLLAYDAARVAGVRTQSPTLAHPPRERGAS